VNVCVDGLGQSKLCVVGGTVAGLQLAVDRVSTDISVAAAEGKQGTVSFLAAKHGAVSDVFNALFVCGVCMSCCSHGAMPAVFMLIWFMRH
jgi:hypothetical protein